MRLFVAVYPPEKVIAHTTAAIGELSIGRAAASGVNVRLARHDQLHVTLVFLGEVPDARQDDAEAAVRAGVARWSRDRDGTGPPALRLAGGGRFGRGRFTILWLGLRGDVPALRELARDVRRELRRTRLPFDDKPFKPHLTIARPGDRVPAEAVSEDLSALAGYESPQWTAGDLVLVRSHLGPKPRYDHLATVPLG